MTCRTFCFVRLPLMLYYAKCYSLPCSRLTQTQPADVPSCPATFLKVRLKQPGREVKPAMQIPQ